MDRKDVCFEIENDEFYKQVLINHSKNFIDNTLNGSEKIEKLNKGIEKLNLELETQVLSKHHDLLTQASHANNLESVIGAMQMEAQGLFAGIEKLRSEVLIPYTLVESQTAILGKIQKVCHIMRHVHKIIELCKVLRNLDNTPSVQASLLYEVEQIVNDGDFEGINLLVEELELIKQLKTKLVENTSQQLQKGLSSGEKSTLLSSFNILNNLHCAKEKINDIVLSELKLLTLSIQSAFNINSESRKTTDMSRTGPGKANVMNSEVFKKCLWDNIQKLFNESMFMSCKKIILLQNALNDLHSFENFRHVANSFWNKLSKIFTTELKNSSLHVNLCIETEFPRLLKYYNDLCTNLHYKHFAMHRDNLAYWENSFLSKCLSKLLDPVRTMWQTGHTPSLEQVDEAVRAITGTLNISLGDKQLGVSLAVSVAKCIKQMSTEAEQRVCMDSDAGQVIEPPTSSQQKNANLSNILYYFSRQINRVLTNMLSILSAESINIIQESVKDIVSVSVLQPFCISINGAVDLILGSMHTEVDGPEIIPDQTVTCSLYMRELQQFLKRSKDIYLCLYEDTSAVNRCCEDISLYCIKIFMYNVCCLRPITPYRRIKLLMDCQHLIFTLTTLVENASNANRVVLFKDLRIMNLFLNSTVDGILEIMSKGVAFPHSLTMFYLFSFGGPDLLSPHQCAGWPQSKFVAWLCEHESERDRIEFITGALQRYENHVMQNQISQYEDVFPIICNILQTAQKELK